MHTGATAAIATATFPFASITNNAASTTFAIHAAAGSATPIIFSPTNASCQCAAASPSIPTAAFKLRAAAVTNASTTSDSTNTQQWVAREGWRALGWLSVYLWPAKLFFCLGCK
jgi:hypothetical protein